MDGLDPVIATVKRNTDGPTVPNDERRHGLYGCTPSNLRKERTAPTLLPSQMAPKQAVGAAAPGAERDYSCEY